MAIWTICLRRVLAQLLAPVMMLVLVLCAYHSVVAWCFLPCELICVRVSRLDVMFNHYNCDDHGGGNDELRIEPIDVSGCTRSPMDGRAKL